MKRVMIYLACAAIAGASVCLPCLASVAPDISDVAIKIADEPRILSETELKSETPVAIQTPVTSAEPVIAIAEKSLVTTPEKVAPVIELSLPAVPTEPVIPAPEAITEPLVDIKATPTLGSEAAEPVISLPPVTEVEPATANLVEKGVS